MPLSASCMSSDRSVSVRSDFVQALGYFFPDYNELDSYLREVENIFGDYKYSSLSLFLNFKMLLENEK